MTSATHCVGAFAGRGDDVLMRSPNCLAQRLFALVHAADPAHGAVGARHEGRWHFADAELAGQHLPGVVDDREWISGSGRRCPGRRRALVLGHTHEGYVRRLTVQRLDRRQRLLAGPAEVGEELHDHHLAAHRLGVDLSSRPACAETRPGSGLPESGLGADAGIPALAAHAVQSASAKTSFFTQSPDAQAGT